MITYAVRFIKTLLAISVISVLVASTAKAQMINQNVQYTKIAMFSGKPIVQDTSFVIKNGTDTLRISIHSDSVYFTTNAGGGYVFNPPLNTGSGGNDSVFWNTGNGNLYQANTSLNVGIGTTAPTAKLQINGSQLINGSLRFDNPDSNMYIYTGDLNGNSKGIQLWNDDNSFDFFERVAGVQNIIANLSLSNSNIFSPLQVLNTLKIQDGTEGTGKVLTSDADGNASWQATTFTPSDSATIYALTPTNGTVYFCTDCSGNGVTGAVVTYFGAAWRRQMFE